MNYDEATDQAWLRAECKMLSKQLDTARAALDAQVPSAEPSTGPTSTVPFAEYAKLCVDFHELKAELETSRECARKWKNELESVRRERDELKARVEREVAAVQELPSVLRANAVIAQLKRELAEAQEIAVELADMREDRDIAQRERDEWKLAASVEAAERRKVLSTQVPRAQRRKK